MTATEAEPVFHRGTREWTRMRAFILFREVGRCYLCRVKLTPVREDRRVPTAYTLDHLIPASRGGLNTLSNLRACCQRCNEAKADRLPTVASCTG